MRLAVTVLLLLSGSVAGGAPDGERLAYVVGCVNCHHQTPKEMINAPSLEVVKAYSLPEFQRLLRTGHTRNGRDLAGEGSLMGIVAVEQLGLLTDGEIAAIHAFLTAEWNAERSRAEEAKIPILYRRYYESQKGDAQ